MALQVGDYDVAVTLAGAAEDMLPGDPEIEVTTALFDLAPSTDRIAPYTWSQLVNLERNWLKHKTLDEKTLPA